MIPRLESAGNGLSRPAVVLSPLWPLMTPILMCALGQICQRCPPCSLLPSSVADAETLVDGRMSSEDGAQTGGIACVQSCDISRLILRIPSLQSSVPLSGAATSQLMIQFS